MVQQIISTAVGKTIKGVASLRGGGSALPGLVIEKVDPNFLARTLDQLPMGVVVISGTNGKTTTTKIVTELLESIGLKVFTNKTGSNFSRGIVAALLGEVDGRGRLDADIAVLELDEAWAAKFVQRVKPRYSLLLNVLRDQLDRFGEIDQTAKLLEKIAASTTGWTVLNRDDLRISSVAKNTTASVAYFGVAPKILKLIAPEDTNESTDADTPIVALNSSQDGGLSTFSADGEEVKSKLALHGIHNALNATAALALVKTIANDQDMPTSNQQLMNALSTIKPAFGRGEIIEIEGSTVELALVKNPSGFRLALASSTEDLATMIAINDNYADGRDMSWLWDVDFTSLKASGVDVVSGFRAYDMALRLKYDEVSTRLVDQDLTKSLYNFLKTNPGVPKKIYCTYTAMTALRRELSKIAKVERVK